MLKIMQESAGGENRVDLASIWSAPKREVILQFALCAYPGFSLCLFVGSLAYTNGRTADLYLQR